MNYIADTLPQEEIFQSGHPFCPGCSGGTMIRWITKVLGPDTICNIAASCLALPTMVYPHSLALPCLYIAMAPSAAGVAGVSAALKVLKRKGKIDPNRKITVIALAGDGSAGDIGMAALSGAAERNEDGIYFVFDNEAYMNTGIQRSGATPKYAWTTSTLGGKIEFKKDLPKIMAAHGIPYVATVSLAYPEDFMAKVEKARDMEPGFKYIHVNAPCPSGWKFKESQTIEVARLAVESGLWLLYEIEHGEFRLSYQPDKKIPVLDYLQVQKRFQNLTDVQIQALQDQVDQTWDRLAVVDP
ncbi:MAG: pyruvate synthase subunit beta [Deltaproteobacteria bacterium]|nr:pyruvate synthase subunit beta [Deltaproteobacteria bacterium]